MLNRRKFIVKFARTLLPFGAPAHRIEPQLVAAARILEIQAEFIHLPNVVLVSFGDQDMQTTETHFIKCSGSLALGSLKQVHDIYRMVVHDESSAKRATEFLDEELKKSPIYGIWMRCVFSFLLSAIICPLAFGGSMIDMWIAGGYGLGLSLLRFFIVSKSAIYTNIFEITVAISISFLARGLSGVRSQIFCYTAITSAALVRILPGFLILCGALELASKNILCGSVRMVYAMIYAVFLGFSLQIGSDLYLLFDPGQRKHLDELAGVLIQTVVYAGTFSSDNSTQFGPDLPLNGTFTFQAGANFAQQHIIEGCYRAPSPPWYLCNFPSYLQFFTVPLFSIISSLSNLQPWYSVDMAVMVAISCVSFGANKLAFHFIFNRSDVVGTIGAFIVGLLGNIYSRKFNGTAFTSMVTGVLFPVPSGISLTGGFSRTGNGLDVGTTTVLVAIGITVGLFMSQSLVYTFGSRKNAATFSF